MIFSIQNKILLYYIIYYNPCLHEGTALVVLPRTLLAIVYASFFCSLFGSNFSLFLFFDWVVDSFNFDGTYFNFSFSLIL